MALRPSDIVSFIRRHREPFAVGCLLVVALALRVYQVNWDQGHLYHPDERYILMTTAALSLGWPPNFAQLLTPQSTLDPHGFAYGTFSFYLLRLLAFILVSLSHLGSPFHFLDQFNDLGNLRLIGRPVSALFDTASVYIIYRLGRQLFGKRVAFLGATFVTFSVIDIQLSHFYATDTILTCFVLASILASVEYARTGKRSSAIWAGVFTGLAFGTKASSAPVLAPVFLAYGMRLLRDESAPGRLRWRIPDLNEVWGEVQTLVTTLAVAAIVFIVVEPYALIDTKNFVAGIVQQSEMVRGIADVPYTRQYFGRPAYLYFLQNLVLFGVGVPLGLTMIAGFFVMIWRAIRRPRPGELIILVYVVPYFAITGDFYAKFMRYLLPITPLLALFAAVALVSLFDVCRAWARERETDGETRAHVADNLAALEKGPSEPDIVAAEGALTEVSFDEWDMPDLARLDGGDFEHGSGLNVEGALEAIPERLRPRTLDVDAYRTDEIAIAQIPDDGGIDLGGRSTPDDAHSVAGLPQVTSSPEGESSAPRQVTQAPPGLSARFAEAKVEAVDVVDLDPDALRFAELKGFSVEWLVDAAQSSPLTDASGSEEDPGPETLVSPGPVPGWVRRSPALLSFTLGVWPRRISLGLIGIVLAFSAFYALAFDHMYASTTTPVLGSIWLYQHAPRGSVIATEAWDEGMPVPLTTKTGFEDAQTFGYRSIVMPMYDPDTPAKLNTIVNDLESANYIVFFSNRLYGTVPRIPARYPMSRRYYVDLFGQKLGFKLVAAYDRYPNLFGIAFVDDTLQDPGLPRPPLLQNQRIAPITIHLGHADESFSVYDHQKVLIFQKVKQLSPEQLSALIGPAPSPNQVSSTGIQPHYKTLVLTPAQRAIVQKGGTFRDLFNRSDVLNHYPLAVWIVLGVLVGLAGVPIGFPVFRFLPDRGYLVSKTLGVLVVVWLSWMTVSLGIVQATRPEALAVLFIVLVASATIGHLQRDAILPFVRRRWRLLAFEEALFWVAYLYDVYIRSLDPDLWHPVLGGEKPMDLAFLIAAIKSPIYPPYDPWFAGGYMNYYYFGQIIAGTLTKISGVVPTTSYNLVIPLLFALTVGGAFTAALSLIHRGDETPSRTAIGGGVLAALMVCVIGNLAGFGQLAQQLEQASSVHLAGSIPVLGAVIDIFDGAFEVAVGGRPFFLAPDWFWASTRVIPGTINEFPYFTFLFADLHAHLMDLPFTLLAIVLCINVVKSRGLLASTVAGSQVGVTDLTVEGTQSRWIGTTQKLTVAWAWIRIHREEIATLTVMGLVIGAMFPTNSWDYPTYLGLAALSFAIPWYQAKQITLSGFAVAVLRIAVVVVLSRLLYQPFYAYFQSFYSGVHPIADKSPVDAYMAIHGLFIAVMVSYFVIEGWSLYRHLGIVRSARLWLVDWELLPRVLELQRLLVRKWDRRESLIVYGAALVLVIAAAAFAAQMAVTGILIILLAIALSIGFYRRRAPEDCLLVFLFATGLAIGIGTEQIALDGDIGRMNTVFKFYEQVWVMWGIASAVAIVRMKDRLLALRSNVIKTVWIGALALLFMMTLVYPVLGTISRVSDRFSTAIPPTLDGTAYMNSAVYVDDGKPLHLGTDKKAMLWIQDHVSGTPTILEGNRPLYRWGSRFSIYTGLPTVIGWDWHEKQQRWGYQYEIDQRLSDVQQMYTNPSVPLTESLLAKYDVKYIIDGELEQAFYPGARQKFDSMVGKTLKVVYNQDGVKIYEVQ